MDKLSARIVADYFLFLANAHGKEMTNLKLQKLVYYAQAWFLALNGRPLFSEDIEAWVLGPAIPSLYREFKKFGYDPIKISINESEFVGLNPQVFDHLNEVFERYGSFEAFELARLTHQEKPWLDARQGKDMLEHASSIISEDSMRSFYSKQLEYQH